MVAEGHSRLYILGPVLDDVLLYNNIGLICEGLKDIYTVSGK